MSMLFGQTRKELPSEAQIRSHELLLRAGYIHQAAAGIFSYLPLGLRVLQKISAILRQEMDAIGAQEINMPVVQPADLWQQSGRWYKIGDELGRFTDRKGHSMALAMTHEETAADLIRRYIRSYRDLPRLVYHLQTKWRDDPRPRAGLLRVREFVMKDSYSLDKDWEGLKTQYRNHYNAYFRIFGRCNLPVMAVLSDSGVMGGKIAHEFMYPSQAGEDTILFCSSCGYSANRQVAQFRKNSHEAAQTKKAEELEPLTEVATPGCKTIAQLANFLQITPNRCAKIVFLVASFNEENPAANSAKTNLKESLSTKKRSKPQESQETGESKKQLVAAVLPGDMELNETKLFTLLKQHLRTAFELRPAETEELRAAGIVPGYASPIAIGASTESTQTNHLGNDIFLFADDLIASGKNWTGGANKEGFHVTGINYGRDFTALQVADLCAAAAGQPCPQCGSDLESTRAVEVGNIFQLGSFYSEALGCYFSDQSGNAKPVLMGSYGIGVGRLAACIAEQHNDKDGLAWPITVAPFQVHLLSLAGKQQPELAELAQKLYEELQQNGIEVLFDEREERPGFKFKDADLIGIPIRLTLSKRSLERTQATQALGAAPAIQALGARGAASNFSCGGAASAIQTLGARGAEQKRCTGLSTRPPHE